MRSNCVGAFATRNGVLLHPASSKKSVISIKRVIAFTMPAHTTTLKRGGLALWRQRYTLFYSRKRGAMTLVTVAQRLASSPIRSNKRLCLTLTQRLQYE